MRARLGEREWDFVQLWSARLKEVGLAMTRICSERIHFAFCRSLIGFWQLICRCQRHG